MNTRIFILLCLSVALTAGCSSKEPSWAKKSEQAKAYERVVSADEDPAENGPDDSTVLNGIIAEKGMVPFKHFSHTSSGERGYGIPCQACHHGTPEGEFPMEGCSTCHGDQDEKDPAHLGPDDNMVLGQLAKKAVVVPFNHFTHASVRGYKNDCDACHHKGGNVGCQNCHREVAVIDGEGHVVPKVKRAYHKLCKERCHEGFRKKNPDSRAPVSCVECHRDRSAVTLGRLPGALSLERAYHLSCISCHQKYKAANPSSIAPVKCKGCHTRPAAGTAAADVVDEAAQDATDTDSGTGEKKAGDSAKGAAVVVLRHEGNKMDPVSLTHHDHQEFGEACSKCHHEGMDEPACSSCHDGAKEAKKVYHKVCVACHKENGAGAGCKDCHKKAAATPTDTGEAKEEAAVKDTGGATEEVVATEVPVGAKTILIDHGKKSMPGTPFPHEAHQELGEACSKCHHEGMEEPKCRTCHDGPKEAKKAYHKLCIGCHVENGLGKKCSSCHVAK